MRTLCDVSPKRVKGFAITGRRGRGGGGGAVDVFLRVAVGRTDLVFIRRARVRAVLRDPLTVYVVVSLTTTKRWDMFLLVSESCVCVSPVPMRHEGSADRRPRTPFVAPPTVLYIITPHTHTL